MAESANVIMDGRDICSYVLRMRTLRFFLPRRLNQERKEDMTNFAKKGIECDFEKIKADMEYRDKNDSQRAVAPLKKADDATLIDTTEYDFDGAVKLVKRLNLKKRRAEICFINFKRFSKRRYTLYFQSKSEWARKNVPKDGGMILAVNHKSNWDPIFCGNNT